MSDRDTLIAMFTKAEIPYHEAADGGSTITLEVTRDTENIIGYTGFAANIHFDADGNLSKIGIWE